MQTANIEVALGGDRANTVPKYEVTAAEIAVLQAIHGNDAVFNVQPLGEIDRSNRDELARVNDIYGKAKDSENNSIVKLLYPGAAARVYHNLDELGLAEEQFAATGRVSAPKATAKVEAVVDEEPGADDEPEELSASEKAKRAREEKAAAKAAEKAAKQTPKVSKKDEEIFA